MVHIVGQDQQTEIIGHRNPFRVINCNACGQAQRVGDAMQQEGSCAKCGTDLCVFCGCVENSGCVHPDFPDGSYTCKWHAANVCDFCHHRITEEAYLIVTGKEHIVRERYREPLVKVVSNLG